MGTYNLTVDDAGIISCGECGAYDLLPEAEAIAAAGGTTEGVDRYADRYARDVLAGKRGRIGPVLSKVSGTP